MTYKKLKVDGKTLRIYLSNSIPDEITRLMGLQGIELVDVCESDMCELCPDHVFNQCEEVFGDER